MRIYPPVVWLTLAGAAWAVETLALGPALPFAPMGWPFVIAGAALAVAAALQFHRHRTAILPFRSPDRLITEGLFAYSRNPIYLGLIIAMLGVGLASGRLLGMAAPVLLFLWLDRIHVPEEEQIVEEAFGEDFEAYRRATRRWL